MKRLLIANRGEIACRIMRTCRDLGIETVAVYSEADREALHVEMADQAFPVGPAAARDSYLRTEAILEVAKTSGADAVHPGYGFLSENAGFARAVTKAGLIWIGPDPSTITDMGDKDRARKIAQASGVPVVPGSAGFEARDADTLAAMGREIGYPLLVKAAAGGGGIGMRVVETAEDLPGAVETTQSMARKAFGDASVFLERFIPRARHIEIQVFGFGDGSAVHLGERDCSVQRRFQKVIEESPAPGLPDEVRAHMAKAATDLCAHVRYRGAGTVEFILDVATNEFFFLEMNTRIQVEHPVTECVTGTDLVAMQIGLAAGTLSPPSQEEIGFQGHAIECRIYAENPAKNFMPSPGRIETFDTSMLDEDTRIDTGFRSGDTVTFYYDPMIAKLICRGATRTEAIAASIKSLKALTLTGITSNVPFLIATLEHRAFASGDVHTGFIAQHASELVVCDGANR